MSGGGTTRVVGSSRRLAERMAAFAERPIMASIRAGVAAVVPLTIVGGLFMLLANPPLPALERLLAPWAELLRIPVTATFGILGLFVCLAVAHELGGRRGQDALSSTILAGASFVLLAVDPESGRLDPAPPLMPKHIAIASAAAVPSSSSEAPASGRAVRSEIIVWKLSSASSRPCAISA